MSWCRARIASVHHHKAFLPRWMSASRNGLLFPLRVTRRCQKLWAHIVDFYFQCRVAPPCVKCGVHGTGHARIKEGGSVSSMNGSERIVVLKFRTARESGIAAGHLD